MSRGPGRIERWMREMLAEPLRLSFTILELVREAYGVGHDEILTEAERSSGARALRKILAGDEWRVSSDRQPGINGNTKLYVRAHEIPTAVWAYRIKTSKRHGVDWQVAGVVRRTLHRCILRIEGRTIETDAALRPFEPSGWWFESIRSPETECRANAAHRAWLARHRIPAPELGVRPALPDLPETVRAAREALREARTRLDDWLSRHSFYLDDDGNPHYDKKLPADLAAAYRRAIPSRDTVAIDATRATLEAMLDRLERQHHDFDAPMREMRAGRRRSEFSIVPESDC